MSKEKCGIENRYECWLKGRNESEKFRNHNDPIFGSPEVFHVFGELYCRIEELEKKIENLEMYLPKPASRWTIK